MSGDVPERLIDAVWDVFHIDNHNATECRPARRMSSTSADAARAVLAAATADDLEALAPQAVAEIRARALREAAEALAPDEVGRKAQRWLHNRAEAEGGPR